MSFLKIKHVRVQGIAACVPARVEENRDYDRISAEEIEKYIQTTGVERRHCAIHDGSICSSDLCYKAAEKLIADLGWDKSEIGLLINVSQTADYRLPATACIMQNRLGLPNSCMSFDITMGCPGFIVGLGTAGSILQGGTIKKALLMVGNTQSEYASPEDRSMYLLLGDAGTVTALEFDESYDDEMILNYMTDGSGYDKLIIPDGGSRNPVNAESFVMREYADGISRTNLHEKMDGSEVFSFAVHYVPRRFKEMMEYAQIGVEDIDYLLLHQANKFMCEKFRKKIGVVPEKCPYNIHEYGNTSGATIPLLMVTNMAQELQQPQRLGMAAVGVGLSLGTAYIKTSGDIVCPEIMYL